MKYFFIIFCVFIFNVELLAKPKVEINGLVNGKVITYDSNGKRIPIIGRVVTIIYNDGREHIARKTDEVGDFHLPISPKKKIRLGKKIKIIIDSKDYFILSPFDGEMFPPESLKSYQLNIIVVSNDSKVQTGLYYSTFKNRDRNKVSKKQGYTIQILATREWNQAVNEESFFRNYNSFKEYSEEENLYRIYVSFYKNRKDAIRLKNKIKKDFKSKRKYQDIFVKSILH